MLVYLWAGEQADTSSRSTSNTPLPESRDPDSIILESAFNIPNNEAIRRLRAKGQPIRLFGESDRDRRLRLRALELIEERGHEKAGTNDFRKALEDVESVERELRAKNDKGKKKDDGEVNNSAGSVAMVDLGLLKTDPDKLYPVIYYALKRTLKEWEEAMDERPGMSYTSINSICLTGDTENVKRTHQGKLAAATQVQSAEYLKPLFKTLRSRVSLPFHSSTFLDHFIFVFAYDIEFALCRLSKLHTCARYLLSSPTFHYKSETIKLTFECFRIYRQTCLYA